MNDKALVNALVSGTEQNTGVTELARSGRDVSYNPTLYASLCRLCHHLLVLHPLALHKFRLLYTLAFRSSFLHRLWNLILDTKRPSSVASASGSVPLLTVIARGIRTTSEERDQIVPLLTVFSSLFGYLLVTINDTEFYGVQNQINHAMVGLSSPDSSAISKNKQFLESGDGSIS